MKINEIDSITPIKNYQNLQDKSIKGIDTKDSVEISTEAKVKNEFFNIKMNVLKAPDIRQERIDQVMQNIHNAHYWDDPEVLNQTVAKMLEQWKI